MVEELFKIKKHPQMFYPEYDIYKLEMNPEHEQVQQLAPTVFPSMNGIIPGSVPTAAYPNGEAALTLHAFKEYSKFEVVFGYWVYYFAVVGFLRFSKV